MADWDPGFPYAKKDLARSGNNNLSYGRSQHRIKAVSPFPGSRKISPKEDSRMIGGLKPEIRRKGLFAGLKYLTRKRTPPYQRGITGFRILGRWNLNP